MIEVLREERRSRPGEIMMKTASFFGGPGMHLNQISCTVTVHRPPLCLHEGRARGKFAPDGAAKALREIVESGRRVSDLAQPLAQEGKDKEAA